jgi:hypothetical protein
MRSNTPLVSGSSSLTGRFLTPSAYRAARQVDRPVQVGRSSLPYGVPVGPFITEMVGYTLYFTCDVNLWLFGHSERPFSRQTSSRAALLSGLKRVAVPLLFARAESELRGIGGSTFALLSRMMEANPLVCAVEFGAPDFEATDERGS